MKTSFAVLQRWHRMHKSRRAQMAARMELLDHLDLEGRDAAWREIFARPEWRKKNYGHLGRCGLCNARIDPHLRTCHRCGAEWTELKDPEGARRMTVFAVAVTPMALLGGVGIKSTVDSFLRAGGTLNPDFIDFVVSYLWIASTIMLLVFAISLYEWLGLIRNGEWRPAG